MEDMYIIWVCIFFPTITGASSTQNWKTLWSAGYKVKQQMITAYIYDTAHDDDELPKI